MTDLTPLAARTVVNRAQGLNEAEGDIIDFTQLGLPPDIVNQIQNIYSPWAEIYISKIYKAVIDGLNFFKSVYPAEV